MADRPESHLTVVEQIYFGSKEQPPKTSHVAYSRPLDTDEQMYERRQTVDATWRELDLGWVRNPALVKIEFPKVRKIDAHAPIEVAIQGDQPFAVVRYGFDMRLEPTVKLWLRCANECKVVITAIPGGEV